MYILGTIRQSVLHNSTGGMEVATHDLYKGLVDRGIKVDVLTSSLMNDPSELTIKDGVRYIFIQGASPGVYSNEYHSGVASYVEYLAVSNNLPNVVHSASGAAKSLLNNQYKIPVIATWHGTNLEQELDRMMSYVYVEGKTLLPIHCEKLLLNFYQNKELFNDFQYFQGHVVLSDFMKECLLTYGIDESKIRIIGNSLPDCFFVKQGSTFNFQKSDQKTLIGLVGRPIPMKGHHFFRKVLEKLNPNEFEILIVGGGDDAIEIYKGIDIKIDFVSVPRDLMPTIYPLFDIYINPTFRYSGFDLTVQEALLSGTLVLNSDVKPYKNYYNELLVKFGDESPFSVFKVGDIDSCINAINRLVISKQKNKHQEYFKKEFHLNKMIDQYLELFYRST